MSKTSSFTRQLLLIRKIRKDNKIGVFPSLEKLIDYVTNELVFRDIFDAGISDITFKRDLHQIKNYFNIPIKYDKREKGYFIENSYENDSIIESVLESFEILSSLGSDGGMPEYIIPEKRKSNGTEHFSFLQSCIKNGEVISFDYFKYDTENVTHPIIAPYALKESQRRWYLLGVPDGKFEIRAYGLDRMSKLDATGKRFEKIITSDDIIAKYTSSFAMFTSEQEPQHIVLSYDKRDGNYVKSFPIHDSQKIEKEEENCVIFSFFLKIELDFIMELLSRSWSVEVIEPSSLRNQLCTIFTDASLRNK